MRNWQLKLVVAACSLSVWGSAQASSPLNWQMGFNLGQRGWESPGYLNQKVNFNVASLSVSTGFEKFFASASYETSLGDKSVELEFDDSQLANYPPFGFENSGAGFAKRNEFSLVGGYNFTNSWSGFVGYVTSEVDISNLEQLTATTISPLSNGSVDAMLIFLNGGVQYASKGPFVGLGYRIPIEQWGALSLSTAYAHLNAEGEVGSNVTYDVQRYSLGAGVNKWSVTDSKSYDRSIFATKTSGNASGFSFGASWFGKFSGDQEWLKSMRYVLAAKLYKYDYNGAGIVPSQTNTDSKETYTVLTLGLTQTF